MTTNSPGDLMSTPTYISMARRSHTSTLPDDGASSRDSRQPLAHGVGGTLPDYDGTTRPTAPTTTSGEGHPHIYVDGENIRRVSYDRRQLVLPVATTIFAGRYGVIIRYGGTVDYRPTNQAIEAETYGRQDTGNGSGQGWDERAFSAQVAERAIAVAGETGASVAHSAGSLRRGVGG